MVVQAMQATYFRLCDYGACLHRLRTEIPFDTELRIEAPAEILQLPC